MTISQAPKNRIWEVDAIRGIAIIEMVIFHLVWDLHFFGWYEANIFQGPWQLFARNIGATFTFVLGVSLTLSYNRVLAQTEQPAPFIKYLRRGGFIFGLGMVITVATYFVIGRGFVIFGILHLLGLSVMVAYPFLRMSPWVSLGAGVAALWAGTQLNSIYVSYPWLIWLGLPQTGRIMFDYYPLLPWFGFALLGIFAGYMLYPQGTRRFALPDWSEVPPIYGLRFLGRHSLLIYMLHQPILLGIFYAIEFVIN